MIVVAVVDADNDAHGKYLLSVQIFRESIINGGGEYVSLAEIFLRKLLRFCLSRLAIGSQNRTASGENSRCNKKAHPAFRQDARKIACGHFQANGMNLVHFAPKSPVFAILYRSYGIKSVNGLHGGDIFWDQLTVLRYASQSRFHLRSQYSQSFVIRRHSRSFAVNLLSLEEFCCQTKRSVRALLCYQKISSVAAKHSNDSCFFFSVASA